MLASAETGVGFMREALSLAESQLGLTTPNPSVGCVIVRLGVVIARGVTAVGGRPHGETQALDAPGSNARGAPASGSFERSPHSGPSPPRPVPRVSPATKRVSF